MMNKKVTSGSIRKRKCGRPYQEPPNRNSTQQEEGKGFNEVCCVLQ
jgi:hypothetical protein